LETCPSPSIFINTKPCVGKNAFILS
jgi:hypothetical protein